MIKKLLFITFMLFCMGQFSHASCRGYPSLGEARKINYELYSDVFLGLLLSIDGNNGRCTFLVLETYKGNAADTIVVAHPFYKDTNDIFSLWIIYGYKSEFYDYIIVNECSISRKINDPILLWRTIVNIPYAINTKDENILTLFNYLTHIHESLHLRNDFYDEIEILRALKQAGSSMDNSNPVQAKIPVLWFAVLLLIVLMNVYLSIKVTRLTRNNKEL